MRYYYLFIFLLFSLIKNTSAQVEGFIDNKNDLTFQLEKRMTFFLLTTHHTNPGMLYYYYDSIYFRKVNDTDSIFNLHPNIIKYSMHAIYKDTLIYKKCNIEGDKIEYAFKQIMNKIRPFSYPYYSIYYDIDVIKVRIDAIVAIKNKYYIVSRDFILH